MSNPEITDLQNAEKYELIAELSHDQIKEFVIEQLSKGGKLVSAYMIYQIAMIVLGLFILTRSIVFAYQDKLTPLLFAMGALLFCFSFLIVIHELLHGMAIKLTGAKKVNYGAYFKRFIFYAEADQHVMNRSQFAFVALSPLIIVKLLTLTGCFLYFDQPIAYFLGIIMCAHSLFCAGDIGLLSLFFKFDGAEIYTYDVKDEKKSYYFKRK